MRLVKGILRVSMVLLLSSTAGAAKTEQMDQESQTKNESEINKRPSYTVKTSVEELIGYDPKASSAIAPVSNKSDSLATAAQNTSLMATMSASSSGVSSPPQNFANSFHFDPYTGSGIISLPIYTPTGRKGVQPPVSLVYSPRQGNGILGFGWRIDFSSIERSTKNGPPTYGPSDNFVCNLNGMVMDLVALGNGDYRPKLERDFIKFHFDGNTWEAKDKQGNTYYFGLDNILLDNSRERNGTQIYRWHLSEFKDIKGNYYFIRHFQDGHFEILYTGEPGTDRDNINGTSQKFQVRINSEMEATNRQDTVLSYQSGFGIRQDKRLAAINVYANGFLQKKYTFTYHYSVRSNRTLLTNITEYGSDGTSSLPAVSAVYQENTAPSYNIFSIIDNPTVGDNLFSVKFGEADHGALNNLTLYPNYNGNPDYGRYSDGFAVPWGSKYTQFSYGNMASPNPVSWLHESNGNISLRGKQDAALTAWTYAFVNAGKRINFTANGDVFRMFLNGDYSTPRQSGAIDLRSGYNLIEVTGYNQNQGLPVNVTSALASQVDLLNSSQVILPQFSADFNGDGLADVASFSPIEGKVLVALSNGTSFLPKVSWLTNDSWKNLSLLLGDFNGDGKIDISGYEPGTGKWRVALSNGTSFDDNGIWINGWSINRQTLAADINGDGLTDILALFYEGGDFKASVALNKTIRFEAVNGYNLRFGQSGITNVTPAVGDFNGDGIMDTLAVNSTTGQWQVGICPGNMVDQCDAVRMDISNFGAGKNPVIADFNSDGITDIGYYDKDTGKVITRFSKGITWTDPQDLSLIFDLRQPGVQVQTADYNGDGLTDFIAYNEFGNNQTALSKGEVPDLLSSLNNGWGGVTTFVYDTSVHYANTFLPFVMPVISATKVSNSLGANYTTRYSYAGGFWDKTEREFWGFATVKVTDAENHYTETKFKQDNTYMKGLISEQSIYNSQNQLFRRTVNTWGLQDIVTSTIPRVKFPFQSRVDTYVYDGNESGKRTAQQFYYEETPQLGNLTKTVQLGEVDVNNGMDIGTDKRTVENQYLNNTSGNSYLSGFPKQVVVKDNAGSIVRKTFLYYDGHTDINALPTTGFLTKQVSWNGDGPADVSPITLYSYDTYYGNLLTTTSPLNHITQISYDTQFHMFPLVTTNAKNQSVTTAYYGINGVSLDDGTWKGLWGQTKSVTDPNNQMSYKSFDVFGRLVKAVSPLDSSTYPTEQRVYSWGSPYSSVTIKQCINHGQSATLDVTEISDGLGRVIQTKKGQRRLISIS